MMTLDQHLNDLDLSEAREEAIQLLAEQMSCASSLAVASVLIASTHDISYKNRNNLTNGSEEFNDMFYSIAEKLIESVE